MAITSLPYKALLSHSMRIKSLTTLYARQGRIIKIREFYILSRMIQLKILIPNTMADKILH